MKRGWSSAVATAAIMAQLLAAPAHAVDFADLANLGDNEVHSNGVVFPPLGEYTDETPAPPVVLLAPLVEAASGNDVVAPPQEVSTEEAKPVVAPTPANGMERENAPAAATPMLATESTPALALAPVTPVAVPVRPAAGSREDDDNNKESTEKESTTLNATTPLPSPSSEKDKATENTGRNESEPLVVTTVAKNWDPVFRMPTPTPTTQAPAPKQATNEDDTIAGDFDDDDEVAGEAGARTILPKPLTHKPTPAPVLKNNQPFTQTAQRPPGSDPQPVVSNGGVNLFPYTDDIRNYIVDQHNFARATMVPQEASNMRKMYWNEALAIEAAELVNTCAFEHDTENYAYGQNLMYGNQVIDRETVASWMEAWVVNEISPSDRAGQGFMDLDHASAVLWANSYYVGCASKMCDMGYLTACNYFSPGNWQGEKVFNPGQACSACPSEAPFCDAQYGKLCTANPNEPPSSPIQRPPGAAPPPAAPSPQAQNQRPVGPAPAPAPILPAPVPAPKPAANGAAPGAAPGAGGGAGKAGAAGGAGGAGAAGGAGGAGAGAAGGAGTASASTNTSGSKSTGSKSSGSSSGAGAVSTGPVGATVPSPSPAAGGDQKQSGPGAVKANQKSGATTATRATLSVVTTAVALVVVNVW